MEIKNLIITDFNNSPISIAGFRDSKLCKKIEWKSGNKSYKMEIGSNIKQAMLPFLSPSKKELIVFFKGYVEFPEPNNVAIFDYRSKLIAKVKIPTLISNEYKEYENKVGKLQAVKSLSFLWPIIKRIEGKDVLFV